MRLEKATGSLQLVGDGYAFPLLRLWVLHNNWQLLTELSPPLLHAATWSASISSKS